MESKIPPPQRSRVTLSLAGFQHVSPYTNTAIASVTFGSRRVWKASYVWDVIVPTDNDKLESFLLRISAGQGAIPLYFFAGGARGNKDVAATFSSGLRYEQFPHSEVVRNMRDLQSIITHVNPSQLTLSEAAAEAFGLEDNYNLQVGRFCLRVTDVNENKTIITVANMPVDPITGESNLLSRLGATLQGSNAEIVIRNHDFFMIGKNVSFDVGHEESIAAAGTYLADPIEFIEVL